MAISIDEARKRIVEAGGRLYRRGLVGGSEGNISVRIEGNRLLATPSGVCKGFLDPLSLVITDLEGGRLAGETRPSSELRMHTSIYALREDVSAVVHAHPPTATGFAIAGRALDDCVVPEVIATLGWVPIVPYGTPSTEELSDQMVPYIAAHDALLLANHGAVTYASTLETAINAMESIEQASRSLLVAHLLGHVNRLSRSEVERLLALNAYGTPVRNPGCSVTDPEPLGSRKYPGGRPESVEERELRERIAEIVRDTIDGGSA